eukprot:10633753-Ditylum_brightwellii.AAC.1
MDDSTFAVLNDEQSKESYEEETNTVDDEVENKYHQLHYAIRSFNCTARNTSQDEPHASFDEGGVAMHSQFCSVRQYNKEKPDKFRVDFLS